MAGKFEPKIPVKLNPPKDDPISKEYLAKCNGMVTTIDNMPDLKAFRIILTVLKARMAIHAM